MKRSAWRTVRAAAGALMLTLMFSCGGDKTAEDPQLAQERRMVSEGIEILRGGTSVQRDSVIRTFNYIQNPHLLHPYLNDDELTVRIGVISALGNLRDVSAVDTLNRMLRAEEDYLLRETVVWALGELGDTSSVPVMVSIMNDTTENRDLRLGLPITLASFVNTAYAGRVEQAFVDVLREQSDDIELCSYVAVGIMEVLRPGNYELFREQLPLLRRLAERRRERVGEDGIYTNLQLAIEELEGYEPDAT